MSPADPISLREAAVQAVRRLQEARFTALWAGGCVRDLLRGTDPVDYDIATNATPDQVQALFAGAIEVGKAFGVVRVPCEGAWFEVATFRQDQGYRDGRRPDGIAFSDPPTDAARRDFTVNALFYDPLTGAVLDFVEGQQDLAARRLRFVGNPADRIREDHLRLLRAVRFTAVLEFALESSAQEAIRAHAELARQVSPERVREELTRTFTESHRPGDALRLLDDLGLLTVLLPEVKALQGQAQPKEFHPEGDVFEHTVLMMNLMVRPTAILAWAGLLHDIGKPQTAQVTPERIRFDGHDAAGADTAQAMLRRLRFSNEDSALITACIRHHMQFMNVREMRASTLRRIVGRPSFPTELEMHRLDCLASHGGLDNYEFLADFRNRLAAEPVLPKPWLSGHDILQMGVPQGPAVGRWRQLAYDAQLDGKCGSREELLAWLKGQMAAGPTQS